MEEFDFSKHIPSGMAVSIPGKNGKYLTTADAPYAVCLSWWLRDAGYYIHPQDIPLRLKCVSVSSSLAVFEFRKYFS